MADPRPLAIPMLTAALGALVGYGAERRWLRPRLAATRAAGLDVVPGGERSTVIGPGDVEVSVEAFGSDTNAPTIVFAHGWTMTRQAWIEQIRGLGERYRLVTYDQPGHGRSSGPEGAYSFDLLGDALAAVAADTGDDALVLVGHSLGGMTVLNALRRHPDLALRVRSVVLSSTASSAAVEAGLGSGLLQLARFERLIAGFATRYGQRTITLSRRVYRASSDLSYLLVRHIGLSGAAAPHHVDLTEQLLLDSNPEAFLGFAARVLGMDEDEGLACLQVPTWIVVGDHDRVTPRGYSRRMAAACPHAELVELPGVGHMVPLEAADAFNALVERAAREAA